MGIFSELDMELRETELWGEIVNRGDVPYSIRIYAKGKYTSSMENIKETLTECKIPLANIESSMPFCRESVERLFSCECPKNPE